MAINSRTEIWKYIWMIVRSLDRHVAGAEYAQSNETSYTCRREKTFQMIVRSLGRYGQMQIQMGSIHVSSHVHSPMWPGGRSPNVRDTSRIVLKRWTSTISHFLLQCTLTRFDKLAGWRRLGTGEPLAMCFQSLSGPWIRQGSVRRAYKGCLLSIW